MMFIEHEIKTMLDRDKRLARYARYTAKHPKLAAKRAQQWQKENRERYNAKKREHYHRDMQAGTGSNAVKEQRRREAVAQRKNSRQPPMGQAERVKRYRRKNLAAYAERQRARYARRLGATPIWANLSAIRQIYKEAEFMSLATGIPHDVDHIIPLKSLVVCGLHVETNLRVIPRNINIRKGNKLLEEIL